MNFDIIYNENCFDTLGNHIDDKSIDIVMTSPPYNMTSRKGGISDTGRYDVYKDWMGEEEYIDFTIKLFDELDSKVKDHGVILYNFSYSIENPSLPYLLISALNQCTNWALADTIIWKKSNGMPFPANERRLSRIWEFVWVIVRKNEIDSFNCHKGISKKGKNGQNYYNVFYNLIDAKNNDGEKQKLNQAVYSSDLCIELFKIYADEGYVIYDPFMGIGTTAIACKKSNKTLYYIGSEISEEQCKYAEERIKRLR